MDGLELYRRIREISAGTVAIVVTAYASSDTANSVRAAGAWQIVPKPVNIGKLLGLVSEALETPLILVVDDDRDLCENLWDLLRERGYRVHVAHDVPGAELGLPEGVTEHDDRCPSRNRIFRAVEESAQGGVSVEELEERRAESADLAEIPGVLIIGCLTR
jgi:CheY-like chemotaxis protein